MKGHSDVGRDSPAKCVEKDPNLCPSFLCFTSQVLKYASADSKMAPPNERLDTNESEKKKTQNQRL